MVGVAGGVVAVGGAIVGVLDAVVGVASSTVGRAGATVDVEEASVGEVDEHCVVISSIVIPNRHKKIVRIFILTPLFLYIFSTGDVKSKLSNEGAWLSRNC